MAITVQNSYSHLATQISNNIPNTSTCDNVKKFDPATIMMLISLIVSIVKCWMNKKLSKQAAIQKCRNPNLVDRFLLNRMINKTLDNSDRPIFFGDGYSWYKANLKTALYQTGMGANIDTLDQLLKDYDETQKVVDVVKKK